MTRRNTLMRQSCAIKTLFPRGDGIDLRTRGGRALMVNTRTYIEALGHDPSPAELGMIRACAAQRLALQTLEHRALTGGEPLGQLYINLCAQLERGLRTLGIGSAQSEAKP